MKGLSNILCMLLLLAANFGFGQFYTSKANECYTAKDFDCAQKYIDSAIVSNERFNSQTWQLRGLIYKKLDTEEKTEFRSISIESFVQARNLDSAKVYSEQIEKFLYSTIVGYFNDAVVQLENGKLENSENSYVLYKSKLKKYIDPEFDFSAQDLEYYNALGSEYLKKSQEFSGEEKQKKIDKGIHFFELILQQDTTLFQPNFNVGIMYYNNGADLIMNMDPLTPIEDIPVIEKKAQEGFFNALPFLLRAHRIDPERTDVIEALAGCHYGLQDNDNYLKFQTILDKINLPKLLSRLEQNPQDREALEELARIYYTTIKDEDKYNKYSELLEKMDE